jgi:hypothetical protein
MQDCRTELAHSYSWNYRFFASVCVKQLYTSSSGSTVLYVPRPAWWSSRRYTYQVLSSTMLLLSITLHLLRHYQATIIWVKTFHISIRSYLIAPGRRRLIPIPSEAWVISGFLTIIFLQVGLLAPRPTPSLEDQTSVFIFPGGRVAQLYPQVPDTHFSRAWATLGHAGK